MNELRFARQRAKYFTVNGINVFTDDIAEIDGKQFVDTQYKIEGKEVTPEYLDELLGEEAASLSKQYQEAGETEADAKAMAVDAITAKYGL